MLEDHRIHGMGHGTPIAAHGPEACGTPAPFMLDVGISSTRRIAAFWGLAPAISGGEARPRLTRVTPPTPPRAGGVAGVINDALRAAGLLR